MEINKLFIEILCLVLIDAAVFKKPYSTNGNGDIQRVVLDNDNVVVENLDGIFDDVYTDCFLHLSFLCLQNKTLLYLKQLNNLSEVSVIGDYVTFVKLNSSNTENSNEDVTQEKSSDELAYRIDKAIDNFFDNHVIKFSGLEREIPISKNVDEFVGRKKRKGGGGGGHGGDDGGKKKMMMMAMMCMKMKLMMMVPAMMGMMGMMSFKGMMFSMMSFMVSKIMLLMKILEKKGGVGGGIGGLGGVGGVGGDGGWAVGSSGGGAWMPAGGQDYAGGGYDANGQWQSRSILEKEKLLNQPIVTYMDPLVRHTNSIDDRNLYYDIKRMRLSKIDNKPKLRSKRNLYTGETLKTHVKGTNTDKIRTFKNFNNNPKVSMEKVKSNRNGNNNNELKSRNKRSLIDAIQNTYIYWVNKLFGLTNNRRTSQKYKIINGVRYIYYPFRKVKATKEVNNNNGNLNDEGVKSIIAAEDFNKGEIIEGGVESRMNRKKFHKMKDTMYDTIDENPWE